MQERAKLFDIDRIKYLWNDRIVYYVYSLVAGLTGLRAGELLALTINEVTQNKIIVRKSYNESYGMSTTKTSEERVVPITSEIYRLEDIDIECYRECYVFTPAPNILEL